VRKEANYRSYVKSNNSFLVQVILVSDLSRVRGDFASWHALKHRAKISVMDKVIH